MHITTLRLENETKGALRYEEVDAKDEVVDVRGVHKIGKMYLRKHPDIGMKGPFPDPITTIIIPGRLTAVQAAAIEAALATEAPRKSAVVNAKAPKRGARQAGAAAA